jgi:methylmalonyl-CoA/ethylmalonyl-CoA epimerase
VFKVVSLDHIGLAVHDIEKSAKFWSELIPGITIDSRNRLELVRAENYMLGLGSASMELLAPLPGDTALTNFLEKRGEGFYFLTLYVDDILEGLEELESKGIRIIESWGPRKEALHVFTHPRDSHGVYLQLIQWDRGQVQGGITTKKPMPKRPERSDPANGYHLVALDHVVHAVKDLDSMIEWWEQNFRTPRLFEEPTMKEVGVRDMYMNAGNAWIELMSPLPGEEPLTKWLETKGEGIYFVAFEVENLAMGIDRIKDMGVRTVEHWGDPKEAGIVFLHPKSCNGLYTCLVDSTKARELRMGEGVVQGGMVRG